MRILELLLTPILHRRTVGYPDAAADAVTTQRTPRFLPEACSDQRACLAVCPTSAITIESIVPGQRRWAIDFGACIFCAECIRVCPSAAIVGTGEFEKAVVKRDSLIEAFVMHGDRT